MKRTTAYIFILIVTCSLVTSAQSPRNIFFEQTGLSQKSFATTIPTSKDFMVFYDYANNSSAKVEIRFRLIRSNGNFGPTNSIVSGIDWGMWQVVWSPYAKRFMLVYVKDRTVYSVAVRDNGRAIGNPRKLFRYTDSFLQVAWTNNKRFIVFVTYGGQLAAQVVKKNGKASKSLVELTTLSAGEVLPIDSATESDGTSVVYFTEYDISSGKADLKLIKVNQELTPSTTTIVTGETVDSRSDNSSFHAAIESDTDIHAFTWKFSSSDTTQYATMTSSGTLKQSVTDAPVDQHPYKLIFDEINGRFKFFSSVNITDPGDKETFFFTIFNPNGSVTETQRDLHTAVGNLTGHSVAINKQGRTLITWCPDVGQPIRGYFMP